MKVLMLGWEFPPLFAGGLGMVCYELTKALSKKGIEITYLMAYSMGRNPHNFLKIIFASSFGIDKKVTLKTIPTLAGAYMSPEEYKEIYEDFNINFGQDGGRKNLYGKDLFREIFLYAERAKKIARYLDFDVIHAHDWMTFPAAIAIAKITNKPFIAHVHNTIFDRYLGNASDLERDIEISGLKEADKVIAISNLVRNRIVYNYGIDPSKIVVIHNGANEMSGDGNYDHLLKKDNKIVLFAGRVTAQKGPEYFLMAAKKVIEYEKNVKFLVAGGGDMLNRMIELAAHLGISKDVIFHGGFFTREEAEIYYSIADVFVMPSVSEPFGIVPLEAIVKGTPTIISKQSGISEVLQNTFKVDFWDTDKMAHLIISLLRYTPLHEEIKERALQELYKFDWNVISNKVIEVYKEVL